MTKAFMQRRAGTPDDAAAVRTDRVRFHGWLGQAPGSDIAAAEVELLDRLLPDLFGYHLLQVGRLGEFDLLGSSRILSRSIVEIDDQAPREQCSRLSEENLPAPGVDTAAQRDGPGVVPLRQGPAPLSDEPGLRYPCVRGAPDVLPFDADSVDVVVLPHTLEFVGQPHETLREAMRVLVADGHMVLCGFNPWSLLGLCARTNAGIVPWRANLLGASRVKDWLKLLGLELLDVRSCFFRPPFSNPNILSRLDFIERLGERASMWRLTAGFGAAAGVYVMVARKRVTTITPVRPRWSPRTRLAEVGLAGPSAQGRDAA